MALASIQQKRIFSQTNRQQATAERHTTMLTMTKAVILLAVVACIHGVQLSDRQVLFKHLMEDYELDRSKDVIPENDKGLDVKIGMNLNWLQADSDTKTLTGHFYLVMMWSDYRLQWDPEAFGGITQTRVPSKYLWLPDIALFNGLNQFIFQGSEINAVVFNDGTVLCIPMVNLQVPYKVERGIGSAFFKLGSWTQDGNQLDLDFYNDLKAIDTTYYQDGGIKLTDKQPEAVKNIKHYPGIPEPYPDLTFNVTFQE